MLKDQNAAQEKTIANLKKEIRELELSKARQESQKAELEYNLRAAEYNVEIIKNQMENVNTETALMKAQHEKVQKSFNYLKIAYNRIKGEADTDTRKKAKRAGSRKQKSQLTTPNGCHMGDKSDFKTVNGLSMLDISGASAFVVPDTSGLGPDNMRMSVAPSDLGQSLLPYLSVEHHAADSQCDIWSVAEMAKKEEPLFLI